MNRSIKFDPSEIPAGGPRLLKSAKPALIFTVPLVGVGVLLVGNIYAAITARACPSHACTFSPVLSNEVLVQVAAMIVAAWFVVRQISFSSIPHIGYSGLPSRTSTLKKDERDHLFWLVTFGSDGTGAALIAEVFYEVDLKDGRSIKQASFEEVRDLIVSSGLREYEDFILWKLSAGAAVVPNIERPLFECPIGLAGTTFKRLDVIIFYRGRMGDLWGKRICCVRGTDR